MKSSMGSLSRGLAWAVLALLYATSAPAEQAVALSELAASTHVHGIAVDLRDGNRLYLATHHGLFMVDGHGVATRVSENSDDYMGFTGHPTNPDVLYASGHPAGGGNLGFMTSIDAGKSWRQVAPGAGGPVDFHQMDVSKADPDVIYGAFGGLQVSRDGGKTWRLAAPLPEGLIDIAASATRIDRLYAATKGGLLVSSDAGASWEPAHLRRSPATLVQTGFQGELYAFVLGAGLVRTREPALSWEVVNNGFGRGYLLHLAVDPAEPRRLYAVTSEPAVIASQDGGATWHALAGAARR